MRRTLILTILSTLWLVGSIGTAHASCLAPPPIEQAIDEAHVVFVGTVVDFGADTRQAVVDVESVWKGEGVAKLVSVVGGFDPNAVSSIDRSFEPGMRYIFFPGTEQAPFIDNACTSTQTMTDEIAELQPGSATIPVDGEAVSFETTGGGDPAVAPPPDGVVRFGPDDEPPVLVPEPVVIEEPGPIAGPIAEPEPRPSATASSVDGVADSYLLPMLIVGALVGLSLGGVALVRRLRTESIE